MQTLGRTKPFPLIICGTDEPTQKLIKYIDEHKCFVFIMDTEGRGRPELVTGPHESIFGVEEIIEFLDKEQKKIEN